MGIIFECCLSEWPGHLYGGDLSSGSMSQSWIGERNLLSSLQRPGNASWFPREPLSNLLLLSPEWGISQEKAVRHFYLTCGHTPGTEITDLKQISSFNPSTYWWSCVFSFSNIPWSNAKLMSIKKIGITLLWEIFLIVSYQFYILYREIKIISCNIFLKIWVLWKISYFKIQRDYMISRNFERMGFALRENIWKDLW